MARFNHFSDASMLKTFWTDWSKSYSFVLILCLEELCSWWIDEGLCFLVSRQKPVCGSAASAAVSLRLPVSSGDTNFCFSYRPCCAVFWRGKKQGELNLSKTSTFLLQLYLNIENLTEINGYKTFIFTSMQH